MNIELQEKNTNKAHLLENDLESIHSSTQLDSRPITAYIPYEHSHYELPITKFLPPQYYKYRHKLLHCFSQRMWLINYPIGPVLCFLLASLGFLFAEYYIYSTILSKKQEKKLTGSLASISLALSYTFAAHNSIWTCILGIPFERGLFWHKFFAFWAMALSIYHCFVDEMKYDLENLSGIVLGSLMFSMAIFAFFVIRRKFFEFFHVIHWLIFILIIVFAVIHGAGEAIIGIVIYLIDLFLRFLIIKTHRGQIKTVNIEKLPSDILRIAFIYKNLKYKPGQYLFICFPKLSLIQWHPFSLSSNPSEEQVLLHIRVIGNWTRDLYNSLKKPIEETEVYIDGPYGNAGLWIDNEEIEIFMLISGGIGITPMQSILNELENQRVRGRPLRKILFIWSVRDRYTMNSGVLDGLPNKLPGAFQPDLIDESHSDIIEYKFHLTDVRNEADFYKGNIHLSKQKNVKLGRPKLEEYYKEICELAKVRGDTKIGVLCCGPEGLMNEARGLASKYRGDIQIEYHEETFEF